jgi:transposase-like protein
MNLLELSYYLQNEEASKNYLLEKGILKNFTECPYCGSDKLGSIRRDRKRCYKCKKEWHQRKGSFLESRHISYSKFIGFLKLYGENSGLYKISNELILDYKTVKTIFRDISRLLHPEYIYFQSKTPPTKLFIYSVNGKIELGLATPDKKVFSYLMLDLRRYKEVGGIYSFTVNSRWIQKSSRAFDSLDRFLSRIL